MGVTDRHRRKYIIKLYYDIVFKVHQKRRKCKKEKENSTNY